MGNQRLRWLAGVLSQCRDQGGDIMLSWIWAFLSLAVIAGVLGFTGIAGGAAGTARVLFFVFIALLIVGAFFNALRHRPPV